MNLCRVTLHHRLRVADKHIGRIVVSAVDKRLNLHWPAAAQPLGKVPRYDDSHLRVAMVESPRDCRVAVHHARDFEVLAGLEALQQVLALLAAVLVVHINRQPLQIQIDAVTK